MMKGGDFLGDSVPSRQQLEPRRWTLKTFPSDFDTELALRTQASGPLGAHLQHAKTRSLWVI